MSEVKSLFDLDGEQIFELLKDMLLKYAKLDIETLRSYTYDYFIIDDKTLLVKTFLTRGDCGIIHTFTIKAKLEDGKLVPVEVS